MAQILNIATDPLGCTAAIFTSQQHFSANLQGSLRNFVPESNQSCPSRGIVAGEFEGLPCFQSMSTAGQESYPFPKVCVPEGDKLGEYGIREEVCSLADDRATLYERTKGDRGFQDSAECSQAFIDVKSLRNWGI